MAVYPCVYRELFLIIFVTLLPIGLSLCIQGTRYSLKNHKKYYRFIPVYTGNSVKVGLVILFSPVYPCVYRELYLQARLPHIVPGLSLCIQGTLRIIAELMRLFRFIPVYTGNSSDKKALATSEAVYPCVYREL